MSNLKEQITCTDNVLLKSDRLVVPATLQERIVDRFRRPSGHSKDEAFLPCMDEIVETKVKACLLCQVVTPVPLQMSVLPDSPFDEAVRVDLVHVDSQTLLLVIDDNSGSLFAEPVSSASTSAVIPKLDQSFNLELICTCEFSKAEIALAEAARAHGNFSFLKNSLVQINSKLNSKPYDYLYKLHSTQFNYHYIVISNYTKR